MLICSVCVESFAVLKMGIGSGEVCVVLLLLLFRPKLKLQPEGLALMYAN